MTRLVALLCLLGACSAEPARVAIGAGEAASESESEAEAASEARELSVVWVGDRDADGPLLVLLHGYRAPAEDLVPLARSLRNHIDPSLRVALPGAPIRMGRGRGWWFIEDGPRPADRSAGRPDGLGAARRDIERLLTRWRRDGRSDPARTVIAGFSQGGMLAMEVGLHSQPPLAGIANLSGGALDADAWVARAGPTTAIFTSHGRSDPLLSFDAAERLTRRLQGAGATVTWLPFDGTHGIPPVVESGLARFVERELTLR